MVIRADLISHAIERFDLNPSINKISTYVWDACNDYWKRDSIGPTRPLDSIILPSDKKKTNLQALCVGCHRQKTASENTHLIG